jgi:hypothetical protein
MPFDIGAGRVFVVRLGCGLDGLGGGEETENLRKDGLAVAAVPAQDPLK